MRQWKSMLQSTSGAFTRSSRTCARLKTSLWWWIKSLVSHSLWFYSLPSKFSISSWHLMSNSVAAKKRKIRQSSMFRWFSRSSSWPKFSSSTCQTCKDSRMELSTWRRRCLIPKKRLTLYAPFSSTKVRQKGSSLAGVPCSVSEICKASTSRHDKMAGVTSKTRSVTLILRRKISHCAVPHFTRSTTFFQS